MLTKCPDCGGNLEEGAMIDFTYGGTVIQRHAKATIPKEAKLHLASETQFEDIRRVISYRCVKCNRLFPYAQDLVLGKTLWQLNKSNIFYSLFIGAIITVVILIVVFAL